MDVAVVNFAGFNFLLVSRFPGFKFCWIRDLLDSITSLGCRLVDFPGAECLPRVCSDVRV